MPAIRLLLFGLAALPAIAAPSGPLLLVPNRGQARPEARFLAKTPRFNVYFERRETVLEMRGAALRIGFLDAEAAGPKAEASASGEANFLTGPEETWVTGVPILEGVAYREIYPGVDAFYRGSGPNLKSEYVVAPGGDPARIRLIYSGADRLEIEPDGSLTIRVGRHTLRESAPVIYQERGGARIAVDGAFQVNGNVVSFAIGGYDRTLPLTIDPVLYYLTLFGGSGADAALSMAVDSAGAAYIAGFTSSYDLPTASAEQNFNGGGNEVMVAKLSPQGNSVVYCTYIGGRGDDRAYGVAVDASGAAYIAGSTTSSNFPVKSPLQAKLSGGRDAFVLKLAPAGNALVYSTYLGGGGIDVANAIAVDSAGNAYIAGDTTSVDFPAAAYQKTNRGAPDAFVAKLAPAGSALVYATYLGGSSEEHALAIAVDSAGSAFVTGSTYSPDFPVANAYQPALAGGQDAFLTKLAADGKSLIFSTYLGGSGGMLGAPETGRGVAVDGSGSVYVAGETSSVNFPIRTAAQSANAGWQDAFVSKFGATGALIYSTYIGGVNLDAANAIAVDRNGYAYAAGQTTSANLASILVSQNAPTGVYDAFVVKLAPAGDTVAGIGYLGGIGADNATAVAVDASANVYLAGWTQSPNFSVVNGIQTINGGNYSAFAGKMNFTGGTVSVGVSPVSAALSAGQTRQFTATVANASNTAVTWSISPAGVGSISSSGLYTAPSSVSTQQTVTVTATSVADPTKSASAAVTLTPPVRVTVQIAPLAASLAANATQQFTATVLNASNTAVTWSISPTGVGSISSAGLYTTPSSITAQQTVTVRATSAADPTASETATITLVPTAAAIRINAGGGAYTDSLGRLWSADGGYLEGFRNSTTAPIAGTTAPTLYQTEHYSATGSLTYRFDLPNGNYALTLKFAEIWYTSAGQRAFDIAVNGAPVRAGFDVYAAAGGPNRAYDITSTVAVTQGKLTIVLTAVKGFPKINGIEILPAMPDFAVVATPESVTVAPGEAAKYTLTVNPSGGFAGDVQLSVSGLPSGAAGSFNPSTIIAPGSATLTVSTSAATPIGSYALAVTATSGGLTRTASLTIAVRAPAIRMNAGGPAFTDALGQKWWADSGYLQGFTNSTVSPISNTNAQPLYQTEHFSTTDVLSYQFSVPNGAYSVTLKFAEIWYTSSGQRLFNIAINGTTVRSNFDVFAAAGGPNKAYDLTLPVTVTNAQISIVLTAVKGYPKINAIEIR